MSPAATIDGIVFVLNLFNLRFCVVTYHKKEPEIL